MQGRRSTAVLSISEHAAKTLAREAREQSALYRLTDRLYRARSLDQSYAAALDAIGDALGCARASILRFDAAGTMRFVAWRGLSDSYRSAVDGHSPWRSGEQGVQPIFVEDILLTNETEALKKTILAENIRALAFIPLAIDDRVVGKFMVYYDREHAFAEHERELSLTIARQLGFAIERNAAEGAIHQLAALVESSDDAIAANDLDGIITSWNRGAERLLGYSAAEAVGRSVLMLFPPDRLGEEPAILARICAGQRVEHYETVRRCKDGSLIDISLSVSPIVDRSGRVIGASKIARDISDRRRAQEEQQLLLREMGHRVKNLFALAGSIVSLNARTARNPTALAAIVSDQLAALARAHALTMSPAMLGSSEIEQGTTLHALIKAILAPYDSRALGGRSRFSVSGVDMPISVAAVTPVALLFHEFATNAAKYGSLSTDRGIVDIACRETAEGVVVDWREIGGPPVGAVSSDGFGSHLINVTARQVGRLSRRFAPDGVVIELVLVPSRIGS